MRSLTGWLAQALIIIASSATAFRRVVFDAVQVQVQAMIHFTRLHGLNTRLPLSTD